MQFVQNFPFFCILLTLMGAVASSVMSSRMARRTTLFLILADLAMNVSVMIYTLQTGDSYAYKMGHFPAPWGNEIRVGVLETVSLTVFLLVILFAFLGGMRKSEKEIEPTKYNIYCILTDLVMLSLIALVYTNDMFTAFVFIEINTLAAAGLVMMRQGGRALVAGVRYMMMNLLGSSLFLIGCVILYTITGHLLMVNIRESVAALTATGQYHVPLTVVVSLISVGLAMKCALFPFDKWLPAAYSNSTPTGSAMLSSIVSKGYIFLLIKVYVRVIGFDVIRSLGICDVLFIFGAIGMVAGLHQRDACQDDAHDGRLFFRCADRLYLCCAGTGERAGRDVRTVAHAGALGDQVHAVYFRAYAGSRIRRYASAQGSSRRVLPQPAGGGGVYAGRGQSGRRSAAERVHHQGDDGAGGDSNRRAAYGDRPLRAGDFHAAQREVFLRHDDADVHSGSRASRTQRESENQLLRGSGTYRFYRAESHTQFLRTGYLWGAAGMASPDLHKTRRKKP